MWGGTCHLCAQLIVHTCPESLYMPLYMCTSHCKHFSSPFDSPEGAVQVIHFECLNRSNKPPGSDFVGRWDRYMWELKNGTAFINS